MNGTYSAQDKEKNESKDGMKACSKAVFDLLKAFNDLPSVEEQEEVLDTIAEAMNGRVFREVMSERVNSELKKENRELKAEIRDLKEEIREMDEVITKMKEADENQGRKALRNQKKGLLIIVSNLRHYLGDAWETVFPNGCGNVDDFLRRIDKDGILQQDTWSRYETKPEEPDTF